MLGAVDRFTLYSMEDGEEYVKDSLGTYCAKKCPGGNGGGKWEDVEYTGKIRIGTRAIYIDSTNVSDPIVKLPFAAIAGLGMADDQKTILISGKSVVLFMRQGLVGAHERRDVTGVEQRISLRWDDPSAFYSKVQDLLGQYMQGEAYQVPALKFDYTKIGSCTEQILLELPVRKHVPLRVLRGNLVLTQKALYVSLFESMDQPLLAVPFSSVVRCARRQLFFAHKSIILHYTTQRDRAAATPLSYGGLDAAKMHGGGDSAEGSAEEEEEAEEEGETLQVLLLSFETVAQCDQVWTCLTKETPVPVLKLNTVDSMQQKWLNRDMSTYEYLLSLNWAAGRSLNDLSQYPIMPWVIADYESTTLDLTNPATFRDLSKPIGALNASRLEGFRQRRAQSEGQEDYLYGTHYSTPTYVLYFLVREHPEWMLYLHNGKFDNGSRLFNSVTQCWKNVNTLTNDVKELIPQFYNGDGAFLVNNSVDLGKVEVVPNSSILSDGETSGPKGSFSSASDAQPTMGQVPGRVGLPPWASDPADFIRKNRLALECEHVSAHIGAWIDLVFGCHSRGVGAEETDNVFHPLSYGERPDGRSVFSDTERPTEAEELQIKEFGQAPLQLFKSRHPARAPLDPSASPPRSQARRERGHTRITQHLQPVTKLNSVLVSSPRRGSLDPHSPLANSSFAAVDSPADVCGSTGLDHPAGRLSFSLRTSFDRERDTTGVAAAAAAVTPPVDVSPGSSPTLPGTLDLKAELEAMAVPVPVLAVEEDEGASAAAALAAAGATAVDAGSDSEETMPQNPLRMLSVASVECMRRNATACVAAHFGGGQGGGEGSSNSGGGVPDWLQRLMKVAHDDHGTGGKTGQDYDDSRLSAAFVCGEGGQVPVVDLQSGTRLRTLQLGAHTLTALAVEQEQHNDNGRLLFAASQDDHVYCYGLDTGRLEDRVCVGGGEAAGSPTSLAVSQGRTLAVGSESGTIRMYQVDAHAGAGGTFLSRDADTALMEHQGAVVGLSWGDAGSNLLASCGGDSLLVFDTRCYNLGSVMHYACPDVFEARFVGAHGCDTGGNVGLLCRDAVLMLDMRRIEEPLWREKPPLPPPSAGSFASYEQVTSSFIASSLVLTPGTVWAATQYSVVGYEAAAGSVVAYHPAAKSPIQAVAAAPGVASPSLVVVAHPGNTTTVDFMRSLSGDF